MEHRRGQALTGPRNNGGWGDDEGCSRESER